MHHHGEDILEEEYKEDTEQSEYNPKVRWAMPQRLDAMTFVGKNVLAIAHDIYIIFLDFKYNTEIVYVANGQKTGDGVDVISGHKSYMFAFAEKVKNARIFVVKYPSLVVMAKLKDTDVNRYKGLCMMECDLIAGFSGFPNYICTVWSWRTNQRLVCVETGVVRRTQIFMASQIHMTICECWGQGLIVWEVGQCHGKCFLLRRAKDEVSGWELADPPLVDVCWSHEGTLYAIDPKATLYSVASDGIAMVTTEEWTDPSTEGLNSSTNPRMCAFGSGIFIYGPGKSIRWLKKDEKSWKVVWTYTFDDIVKSLLVNSACDTAAVWTSKGFVYKITGDSENKIDVELFTYKMRNIKKIALLAPDYKHLVVMNEFGTLALYEVYTAKLILMKNIQGQDISFETSPVEPLIIIFGEVISNYGMALYTYKPAEGLKKVGSMCLTHQIVSKIAFSPTGRTVVAVAMSAGHIFIIELSQDYKMTLVRYTELGRGLADCFLMKVGETVRCFSLVLFSDKYSIGERVVCINAETGKDNKFAGKMQGPYARLLPCATRDTMVAIPHLTKSYHILKLSSDKGVTVSVKMGPIIHTGHDIKQFDGFSGVNAFLTFSYDGNVILREPDAPEEYKLKLVVTHRYPSEGRGGVREALVGLEDEYLVHLAGNSSVACVYLRGGGGGHSPDQLRHEAPRHTLCDDTDKLTIINESDKNYLDLQEDKKIREETMDCARQREDVIRTFQILQAKLVELLEENIAEVPLHQLPLSEFNVNLEAKKERYKQAEQERELLRLETEAHMRAQDKVTAWIKDKCWDTMHTQRVKLFAIFTHYHVENFAILPTQRDKWPELNQIEAFRTIQLECEDLFKPWEETERSESRFKLDEGTEAQSAQVMSSAGLDLEVDDGEHQADSSSGLVPGQPYALSGSVAHLFIPVPPFSIPQTLAYSFLQMNWLQHINKLQTQNLRIWFNKQFDDLMTLKIREVGLVKERNARLRFIVEELNKLSDLRGSFHHLIVEIKDPEWRQEEHTHKLTKVEPEECSIEPYISPSQIVIVPPDLGPKDDFKERALMDMMDGVLEKLWHEEIKKPIPMPQCMLDKDPEHFNEDDLRLVFEYETKVTFRNEERDKYRKMLHAEYAKLTGVLNEGVVKFNQKVKETWLTKVRIDSVIGQENLMLLRLRRTNLDRVEMAEKIEKYRTEVAVLERELEVLNDELHQIQEQNNECLAAYEALNLKDKNLDRTFKNHFADLSPIIVDQCYKFFKRRPKWHQRATMIPTVLYELAQAVLTGVRPALLHSDCVDFFKAMEQLDLVSNMPPVMDEQLWAIMCKLRRVKVDNEIRLRAMAQELAHVEGTHQVWARATHVRRVALGTLHARMQDHRLHVELDARNKTVQLVLPAGQVEIVTTGHMSDFEDATLIPREDIEKINNLILRVGDMKLRMMKKQMDFRKGILSKEWEHAQMKMKLRHMEQELKTYQRLKIPKELQFYLKNKELGYTDEMDYVRLEKEMESSKNAANKALASIIHKVEDLEVDLVNLEANVAKTEQFIMKLNVKVSEKRLNEDPLEPIRIRRIFKRRMETLIARSQLIREVQANHSTIAMLQTELELLRLKTYPTLASFRELQ